MSIIFLIKRIIFFCQQFGDLKKFNFFSVSNKTAISFRGIRVVVRKLLSHDTAVPWHITHLERAAGGFSLAGKLAVFSTITRNNGLSEFTESEYLYLSFLYKLLRCFF